MKVRVTQGGVLEARRAWAVTLIAQGLALENAPGQGNCWVQHMSSRGCWLEGAGSVWREFGCISLVFLVSGSGGGEWRSPGSQEGHSWAPEGGAMQVGSRRKQRPEEAAPPQFRWGQVKPWVACPHPPEPGRWASSAAGLE